MSAITLAQAQAQLQAYLDAETKVLMGQAATLANGTQLTMANLDSIRSGIKTWEAKVNELSNCAAGRRRVRNVSASF